jgi:hypothetical protein
MPLAAPVSRGAGLAGDNAGPAVSVSLVTLARQFGVAEKHAAGPRWLADIAVCLLLAPLDGSVVIFS